MIVRIVLLAGIALLGASCKRSGPAPMKTDAGSDLEQTGDEETDISSATESIWRADSDSLRDTHGDTGEDTESPTQTATDREPPRTDRQEEAATDTTVPTEDTSFADPTDTNTEDRDAGDDTASDNGLFLISPNGGEHWVMGNTYEIRWNPAPGVRKVTLEYSSDEGESFITVSYYLDNTGEYRWSIDPDFPYSHDGLIRVSDYDDRAHFDVNDSGFVLAPMPDDAYEPNDSMSSATPISYGDVIVATITDESPVDYYRFSGTEGDVVMLDWRRDLGFYAVNAVNTALLDENGQDIERLGGFWNTTTGNVAVLPATGTYYCVFMQSMESRGAYQLELTRGTSDGESLTLTSPVGGETWMADEPQTITWESTGAIDQVVIDISYDDGVTFQSFASRLPNTGVYPFTFDNIHSTREHVRFRISDQRDFIPNDMNEPSIVLHPYADDDFEPNDVLEEATVIDYGESLTAVMTWQSTVDLYRFAGLAGESAVIAFDVNETSSSVGWLVAAILDGQGNTLEKADEVTSWGSGHLPVVFPETGTFYLEVSQYDNAEGSYWLSLTHGEDRGGVITVTSPAATDRWEVARTYTIAWVGGEDVPYVSIAYSLDGGHRFETIASNVSNSGEFTWRIPGDATPSENALIRVGDGADLLPQGVSDGPFEIAPMTDDAYEPNDAVETATPIRYDDEIIATMTHQSPVDTYTFSGNAGDHAVFRMISIPDEDGCHFQFALLSSAGEVVYQNNHGSYQRPWSYPIILPETDIYYLVVSQASEGWPNQGDYGFLLHYGSDDGQALTVTSPNGGEVWHAGADEEITWDTIGDIAKVIVYILTDSGEPYRAHYDVSNGGRFPLELSPFEESISNLVVRVYDAVDLMPCDESDGPFSLEAFHDDALEPNDTQETAVQLSSGSTVTATLTADSPTDYFKFHGHEGNRVSVALHSLEVGYFLRYFRVALRDEEGIALYAMDCRFDDAAVLEDTLTYTGVYYLQITPRYGNQGDYSFTLTLEE